MTTELEILDAIRGGALSLSPLASELAGVAPQSQGAPDAYVDVRWNGHTFRVVAELRAKTTPKSFRDAVERVRRVAPASERLPMVISPYLSPERLAELETQAVSGLDLCGNGLVIVPNQLLVLRTGSANQHRTGRKIRNVYQGVSSLVARVFLVKPTYSTVQAVLDEVSARGGSVSIATVSKVLKVLDEDLIIAREGRASVLLQGDKLLNQLEASYRPPRDRVSRKYRWNGPQEDLLSGLVRNSSGAVLTGAASVERYAVMPRERLIQCYCRSIDVLERALGDRLEESARFPDLELIATPEATVFFDSRANGVVPVSSPIQCWLELRAGDKRQRDAAVQVRERIFSELRALGWESP
ncbi:MAG: hypothetical protein AB7I09_20405 [Planctomycetota bacterium]